MKDNKQTQQKEMWGNIKQMSGKTEKGLMKKGNRSCIVDTQDGRNKPYFNVLIDGQQQWQLVHQDRYKLIKKTGKIGNLLMSSLRIK